MRLGRILTSLLAAAVVFTATTAVAANVAVSTHSLGAGGASVNRCDLDGFGLQYNLGANNIVSSVEITDIHANCNAGAISVTLTNDANAAQGSGSATADASGSKIVAISGSPQAADVKKVYIVIVGGQP